MVGGEEGEAGRGVRVACMSVCVRERARGREGGRERGTTCVRLCVSEAVKDAVISQGSALCISHQGFSASEWEVALLIRVFHFNMI